jgi:hypothetical protein
MIDFLHALGLIDKNHKLKQIPFMLLLTLAHRPEAQAFMDQLALRSVKEMEGVYQFDQGYLCITGEGPIESLGKISYILGRLPQISKVLNFGVAGSLQPELALGQIYSVRTVYAYQNGPLFKSFTLAGMIDLVTSDRRILRESDRERVLGMGMMVDRELWGQAYATYQAKIALESYKYISDQAGSAQACEVVKEMALEASLALWEKFQQISLIPKKVVNSEIDLSGLYFTQSQEDQFENLVKKIKIKHPQDFLEKLQIDHFRGLKLLPKDRSKRLLEHMKRLLDPWGYEQQQKLASIFSSLSCDEIMVSSPDIFESTKLKLQISFSDKQELEAKIEKIKNFQWHEFYRFFEGEQSV